MKTILFTSVFIFIGFFAFSQTFNYQRSWGTYFGDERFILAGSKVDVNGNLYIVGWVNGDTGGLPVFTNINSPQVIYGGGLSDGFIAKFNPQGNLIWSSFLGGDQSDGIEGIDIDQIGNVFVIGWTFSDNNIASLNAFQSTNAGQGDMMIVKYSASGEKIWGTYYGTNQPETIIRNDDTINFGVITDQSCISHDQNNHFYISGKSYGSGLSTMGVFQEVPYLSSSVISQFDNNGIRIWTTYYGDNNLTRIRALDSNLQGVCASGDMQDCTPPVYNTYFGTIDGFYPTRNSCQDSWISKFNSFGQRIWSTYYGGLGGDKSSKKSLLYLYDKIYFAGISNSDTYITTAGSFQENSSPIGSPYVVKFSDDGSRNWGTYQGLNGPSNNNCFERSLNSDSIGNIFLSGSTSFSENISTIGAFKSIVDGENEGYISKFNANGDKIWGTYYGGEGVELTLSTESYSDKFYVVGTTTSTQQMTTTGSYQTTHTINNNALSFRPNIFIAHFEPNTFSNNTFDQNSISFYPNPSNGNFTVAIKNGLDVNCKFELYDVLGKKIHQQNISTTETYINTNGLSNGIYLLKLTNNLGLLYNTKIIIE